MTFGWLRPLGKWLLRAIVRELLDEPAAPPAAPPPPTR
jgi:hypothetical protein